MLFSIIYQHQQFDNYLPGKNLIQLKLKLLKVWEILQLPEINSYEFRNTFLPLKVWKTNVIIHFRIPYSEQVESAKIEIPKIFVFQFDNYDSYKNKKKVQFTCRNNKCIIA